MDSMVLKFVALATVVYGVHVVLALSQLLLSAYLIDKEGQVRYNSGLGPYGLSPEALEKEIEMYLGDR